MHRMLFVPLAISCLLVSVACGKADDAKKTDKAKVAQGPPFDCAHFEKRAKECTKELAAAYVTSDFGKKTRGKTDEERAKNLTMAFGFLTKDPKKSLCKHMPGWGNLTEKDPRWQKRYNDCKKDAPCADWGKCVGAAIGNKL